MGLSGPTGRIGAPGLPGSQGAHGEVGASIKGDRVSFFKVIQLHYNLLKGRRGRRGQKGARGDPGAQQARCAAADRADPERFRAEGVPRQGRRDVPCRPDPLRSVSQRQP